MKRGLKDSFKSCFLRIFYGLRIFFIIIQRPTKTLLKNSSKIINSLNFLYATKKMVDGINKKSVEEAREKRKEVTILLHGVAANYYRAMFGIIKWFRKRGVCIVSLGYDYKGDDLKSAEKIKLEISKIMKEARVKKINLIGISLGGIIARLYAEELEGKKVINKLITVYAPPKPIKNYTIGYNLFWLIGKDSALTNKYIQEIRDKYSVKNHLALYGFNDWVTGALYPISKKIKQVGIAGGHALVSYNNEARKISLLYLEGKKIPETDNRVIIN